MSYLLPHLDSGYAVDQAILNEEDRVVVIRFGHDYDETCMVMDEVLCKIAEDVKNFAVTYLVDITEVPDFNTMYVLFLFSYLTFRLRISKLTHKHKNNQVRVVRSVYGHVLLSKQTHFG